MATSSLFTNVVIRREEDVITFVEALEDSERAAEKKSLVTVSYENADIDWVRKNLKQTRQNTRS
jgi:uncharacterized protein (DUF1697 family)